MCIFIPKIVVMILSSCYFLCSYQSITFRLHGKFEINTPNGALTNHKMVFLDRNLNLIFASTLFDSKLFFFEGFFWQIVLF